MVFLNETEIIGVVLGTATQTTTGSMFITLLIFMIILFAIALMFGIQLEMTAFIFMPLMLSYAAYYSEFIGMLCVFIIYLSVLFVNNFWIK